MTAKIDQPLQSAQIALNRMRGAGSYREASQAWEEFLTWWVQALNRCDAIGRRAHGKTWTSPHDLARADPGLDYLKQSRNTVEHGLLDVTKMQNGGMEITAVGSVCIQRIQVRPNGEVDVNWTADDPASHPVLTFRPDRMSLSDLADRKGSWPVPAVCQGVLLTMGDPFDLGEKGIMLLLAMKAAAIAPTT